MSGEYVKVVEVGPRDGLQSEQKFVATSDKLELISRLVQAGLRNIEATSFVSSSWVPQMADAREVSTCIQAHPTASFSALTPNLRGIASALECGFKEVAVFASASETFSARNINCTVDESFKRFEPVMELAQRAGVKVRGYVSCVLGCPFEGAVTPEAVYAVSARLIAAGCYEVSLGDTIGTGHPRSVGTLLDLLCSRIDPGKLAGHFHDTYGMAIANTVTALEWGIRTFDSSVSGLGGCPYAKGATGNLATEDLAYLLERLGFRTGIDLAALSNCSAWISKQMDRPVGSRVTVALRNRGMDGAPAQ